MYLLDCTLRDGGYYNNWDFRNDLVNAYLQAMQAAGVDVVELGFRSTHHHGFRGAYAFTTDTFLGSLPIPGQLKVGVMVNASELVGKEDQGAILGSLFPNPASASKVSLVRIACHTHEFRDALPAARWLWDQGYQVGFNLMQVADKSPEQIRELAALAERYPVDVLYFADSMGSMTPPQTRRIIQWIRSGWSGDIGIHTHDNLGMALQNTMAAMDEGAQWADATVTGMGRGPGNAKLEELVIEWSGMQSRGTNLVPLMALIRRFFQPLKAQYGWGTNPYYYLCGKFGIHPSYVQEMLTDPRYSEEDILAVIEHLRVEGGKRFCLDALDTARHFYRGSATGSWNPASLFAGRDVVLLGSGPGVSEHATALEQYIRLNSPLVLALNTQAAIDASLIDLRAACHPVRLMADCEAHAKLPQPLITPASMLPDDVKEALRGKELLDYGLDVEAGTFRFSSDHGTIPSSLVVAYALALLASGETNRVLMAGFDGYAADDPRSVEMNDILEAYYSTPGSVPLLAITPTRYPIPQQSIYAL